MKENTHSVILNLNKNYSNNTAFDFSTIVNKQLGLAPNTDVALYCGNIVRKPIVLIERPAINLEVNSIIDDRMKVLEDDNAEFLTSFATFQDIIINEGEFSKATFSKTFVQSVNAEIERFDYTEDTKIAVNGSNVGVLKCLPYRFHYSLNNDDYFLGMRYNLPPQQENPIDGTKDIDFPNWHLTSVLDLDDGMTTSNGITQTGGSHSNPDELIIHADTRTNDWNHYALGNSGLRAKASMLPENLGNNSIESLGEDVAFTSVNLKGNAPGSGTQGQDFFWALNNTFYSSAWATSTTSPDTDTIAPLGVTVPRSLIGAYFSLTNNSSGTYDSQRVYITCNKGLSTLNLNDFSSGANRDIVLGLGTKLIGDVELSDFGIDLNNLTTLTWVVYSAYRPIVTPENPSFQVNEKLNQQRVYYFRLQVGSPYQQGNATVLFDSRETGITIPEDVVNLSAAFQSLPNPDDATKFVSGGLCPQYYFKNTNNDFKVINPMGNYVTGTYSDKNNDRNIVFFQGLNNYAIQVLDSVNNRFKSSRELQNILGISPNETDNTRAYANTAFDPNVYPLSKEEGGITQLGSDLTRYNIELNLPVSAYNSTESNANDIGQKRAILFHTAPVIEDTTNISSGLINLNLEPNNLKFLSLNNDEEIKLNTLDIKIRRAKTNQLADEITDCTIELLIKN